MKTQSDTELRGREIMIVDDDPDFLMQLELTLKHAGCTTIKFNSRREAEVCLKTKQVDAMIVDLMMEENDDGFVLAYNAKKLYPDMPIIMVTSVANETGISFDAATEEERAWVKADALLPKPIRAEQITRELKRLLKV